MQCPRSVVIRVGSQLSEFSLPLWEWGARRLSSAVLELLRSLSHGIRARPS